MPTKVMANLSELADIFAVCFYQYPPHFSKSSAVDFIVSSVSVSLYENIKMFAQSFYAFNKYLLSACFVSGIAIGPAVAGKIQGPCPNRYMHGVKVRRYCEENKAFRGDRKHRAGEGRIGDCIRWSGKVLFEEACLTTDLSGMKLPAKWMSQRRAFQSDRRKPGGHNWFGVFQKPEDQRDNSGENEREGMNRRVWPYLLT